MIYWDTSAFLKAHIEAEPSHDRARSLARARERHCSSLLLKAELVGALASQLAPEPRRLDSMVAGALEELRAWMLLSVDAQIERAGELSLRHGLRGADAIHVATALEARADHPGGLRFASADLLQLTAARAEGLRVIDLSR